MMERPAEDLGVALPEPKSSKKKKMTTKKNGVGDGMTKSMRRFLEARAMSAANDAEVARKAAEVGGDRDGTKLEDAVAASTMRFAAARREQFAKNQRQQQRQRHQDDGDAMLKATTKRSNDRRPGDGSAAALTSSGPQVSNVVQSHRTNRQVKRRAFEKKKRQKKRDKRLGVTRIDDVEDYDDEDEEDDVGGQPFMRGRRNRGDFVSANEDDDNLPAFRRVNEAPPSFALGVRGKPFTRNLSR